MSVPNDTACVPALNLKAQYQTIRDEIEPVVMQVLESQMFVLGPEVAALEAEVADYCAAAHGIGCASGSDALLLPLMALDIGPGDEVITTPYTFFATGGRDLAHRGQAGLRRHRARHVQHRPGPGRGRHHAADEGDHPGASLRPDRRHGPDPGDRPAARPGGPRGRRPGHRRRHITARGPARSATSPRSASIPPRTWAGSATAA